MLRDGGWGTSPHLRGNRVGGPDEGARYGDIPAPTGEPYFVDAWLPDHEGHPAPTGEPSSINGRMVRSRGHPRTYGGTLLGSMLRDGGWGTSPHLRGNRVGGPDEGARYGDIPAPTGEPYFVDAWLPDHEGTSPHLRGNPEPGRWGLHGGGDIPAPTGEPLVSTCRISFRWGHPRTCGGTARQETLSNNRQGTSPHLRGNPGVIEACHTRTLCADLFRRLTLTRPWTGSPRWPFRKWWRLVL